MTHKEETEHADRCTFGRTSEREVAAVKVGTKQTANILMNSWRLNADWHAS